MRLKAAIRNALIGIILMLVGSPLFFLSTSWMEWAGVVLVFIGGVMVIMTIARGNLS